MARNKRFPVDCRSWNEYCGRFQCAALEYVPHQPTCWAPWHEADDSTPDVLPLNTAARTIRTGLYGGLAFGLAQDALGLARGRRLNYVDFLLGRRRDTSALEILDSEV